MVSDQNTLLSVSKQKVFSRLIRWQFDTEIYTKPETHTVPNFAMWCS